jgi:O-acetylhomoserine/O-acetylserine sulfhydrylase-like pyridoxal-dependent enzyme
MIDMTEINAAIRQQLPQQIGEELQRELADLATLRAREKTTLARIETLEEQLKASQKLAEKRRKELEQHNELDTRFHIIERRERGAQVFELETQLKAEQRITVNYFQILSHLTRTTGMREMVTENFSGNSPTTGNFVSNNRTVTTTTTEEPLP